MKDRGTSESKVKDKILPDILSYTAWALIKFIGVTQRMRVINLKAVEKVFQERENAIFAFWHNRFVMTSYFYRALFGWKDIVTLVSSSSDGDYLARGLKLFRPFVVRGSSSQGGTQALKNLVREIKQGKDCIITPDGPRGPRYEVQGGVITLALLSKAPIIPVSYDSSRKLILKNWDRTIVTLPFGRSVLAFGDPIYLNRERGKPDIDQLGLLVREKMMKVTEIAEHECQRKPLKIKQ